MNFPPYWAKADAQKFSCWRWSNDSLEDAQELARAGVEALAAKFKTGGGMPQHGYGYTTSRPLRELVLRECHGEQNQLVAVVTRNAYGCLVLNTAHIMFVDVDLPDSEKKSGASGGWLKSLFGGAKKTPAQPATPHPAQAELVAKAQKMVERIPEWGWRIYRTRAGFRLLATHDVFDPAAAETESAFNELGADPLYRQLCKVQKCFRARLTPKPWRCGVRAPAAQWPWTSAKHEERFKRWEDDYVDACQKLATCEHIATLGNTEVHESIQPILALHDESTRAESKLPLA